ncbi:MAG TPA: sialidase family protein [Acidimicrobiales bacterium]|jgi:hypothetical protein|nr:sialidase family protein [Acidimicrobiales bacterium]
MRRLAVAGGLGLALLTAATSVSARSPGPNRELDVRSRPFAFAAVDVPNSNFSEPSIALTKRDSVLFCGPTRPTVAYVRTTDWSTFYRQQLGTAGGSDCDVKVAADNAVLVADLQVFGTDVLRSTDDGASFPVANTAEDPVEQDRQWLGMDPSNPKTVYLAFHDFVLESEVVAKSTDGGQTFPTHAVASATTDTALAKDTYPNTFSGPVRVDPTDPGRVYVAYGISTFDDNVAMCQTSPTACPFGAPRSVMVAVSGDAGKTWRNVMPITSPPGSVIGNLFPWITVDRAGNVYVAAAGAMRNADGTFTNGLFLSMSRDRGATWSPVRKVNAGPGAVVFPTMVAGSRGVLDVAWLESSSPDQTAGDAVWTVHFAQSRNAASAVEAPTFIEVAGPAVRHGAVCTLGLNCSGNRDLGDFMEIDLDSFGYAHVATASTEGGRHVLWWRQDAGPSALSEACAPSCVAGRPKPPGAPQ